MANPYRGEIDAEIGGKRRTLRLTLGALAELEDALGASDLTALAEHFSKGRLSATHAIAVIAAGLRGGGMEVTASDVAAMAVDGGAPAYADIVVRLLKATFEAEEPRPFDQAAAGSRLPT